VLPALTSVVQSQLQAWTLRETQTRWQDLKSSRQAKETIDGLNHQRTKEMLRLPRKTLRLIVYTGHNCLNRHLSVLGLIIRTRIRGKPFLHPSEVPHITVKDLLRFLTSSRRFS